MRKYYGYSPVSGSSLQALKRRALSRLFAKISAGFSTPGSATRFACTFMRLLAQDDIPAHTQILQTWRDRQYMLLPFMNLRRNPSLQNGRFVLQTCPPCKL